MKLLVGLLFAFALHAQVPCVLTISAAPGGKLTTRCIPQQAGPMGPQGPVGPQGPAGPPGVSSGGATLPGVVPCQSLVDAVNTLAIAVLVDPLLQTCIPVKIVQFGVQTSRAAVPTPPVLRASFIRTPAPHAGRDFSWVVPQRLMRDDGHAEPYFSAGYSDISKLTEGLAALVPVK